MLQKLRHPLFSALKTFQSENITYVFLHTVSLVYRALKWVSVEYCAISLVRFESLMKPALKLKTSMRLWDKVK